MTAAPTVATISPVPTVAPTGSLPPTDFSGCPELVTNGPLQTDGVTSDYNTIGAVFDASELEVCGAVEEAGDNDKAVAFFIGFVIGLAVCSILLSTVASGVNTVIVMFADAPAPPGTA